MIRNSGAGATLSFLLRHRTKAPLFTRPWAKQWAKRVWRGPELLRQLVCAGRLRSLGAGVAPSALLSLTRIEGKPDNLTVGEFTTIGRALIQCHAEVAIGDRVVINDGVKILTGSHEIDSVNYEHRFRPIQIDDYAWVATNALVLQGVRIGRAAVVSAGAVVTRDIPSHAVVAGNPAKVVGQRKDAAFNYCPSTWHGLFEAWTGRNP